MILGGLMAARLLRAAPPKFLQIRKQLLLCRAMLPRPIQQGPLKRLAAYPAVALIGPQNSQLSLYRRAPSGHLVDGQVSSR